MCLFILDYGLVLFDYFTCKFVFCFVSIYFASEFCCNSSIVETDQPASDVREQPVYTTDVASWGSDYKRLQKLGTEKLTK